ncbi:hypothetical protein WD019_11075 [Fictibacillus sp. Mic-4]|uniref:hypothetical protein n=1 Tax=Fictibacillus sp. Mic-4 TaxID=3132826 RepID=UPI003CEB524E
MLFKRVLNRLIKNDSNVKELNKKIQWLEMQLQEIKEIEKPSPIVIEKLNVEKICIDKYELNNNFGALGIKELSGKLNIGANYGEGMPIPSDKGLKLTEKREEKANKKEETHKKGEGPSYSIKPRNST